jgi:hypothetical protein
MLYAILTSAPLCTQYGKTAIIHAAQAGQLEVAVEIAERSEGVLKQPCQWGFTAREWADHYGHQQVVAVLQACEQGTFQAWARTYQAPAPQSASPGAPRTPEADSAGNRGASLSFDLAPQASETDAARSRDFSCAPRGQKQGENTARVSLGGDSGAEKREKSIAEHGVNNYRLPPPPPVDANGY